MPPSSTRKRAGMWGSVSSETLSISAMIELIPAIDIIGGKCVRLSKGDYDAKKIYDEHPEEVARRFEAMGFTRLHVVDLDGAKASHIVNIDVLEKITTQTKLTVDFGGGIKAESDLRAAFDHDGPVYIRFGRMAVPAVSPEGYSFEIGKGVTLADGCDVTIIANGVEVAQALEAREMLKAEGIDAAVINMATIKPLDTALVIEAAKKTGAIVTAEEHSVIGGLGGAVAECLAESCPVPVLRVGVMDTYGRSGPAAELLGLFGLDAKAIATKAKEAVALKK